MTSIEVPDWVVARARAAVREFWENYKGGHDCGEFDAAMKAAVTAALGAWVVKQRQCMCTDEDELPNGPRDIWMDVSEDDFKNLTQRNDVRGRTLFTLRQEKPE